MSNKSGDCLCGKIRYEVKGEPIGSEYCHCGMCQTTAGAPVMAWVDYNVDQIKWLNHKPTEYQSSEHCFRGFCDKCGSSLSFRHDQYPKFYTLTINSLDDPNEVKPVQHIHVEDKVNWCVIEDDLPRYMRSKSDG